MSRDLAAVDARPTYMAENKVIWCGECVFEALKIRDTDVDKGKAMFDASELTCDDFTELSAYAAIKKHYGAQHKARNKMVVAVTSSDKKFHLVEITEPTITLP